jgi:hypothetical protein
LRRARTKREEDPFLPFLKQLPALLADQERRAKARLVPIVCIGPGRHPNRAKRIAALIAGLADKGNVSEVQLSVAPK